MKQPTEKDFADFLEECLKWNQPPPLKYIEYPDRWRLLNEERSNSPRCPQAEVQNTPVEGDK